MTKSVGLAAGCLALLVACGSGGSAPTVPSSPSSGSYAQVLQRIASEEGTAQQRVADAFQSKSVIAVRAALTAFEAEQTGLAARLAALMPPANAVEANTALAHAFADSATATHSLLTRIAHAKTVTDAFYVIQSDLTTHQVGKDIGAAIKQLTDLGYLPATPAN